MTAEEIAAQHLVDICQKEGLLFTPVYLAALTGQTQTFVQEVKKLDEEQQLRISAELNRRAAQMEADFLER